MFDRRRAEGYLHRLKRRGREECRWVLRIGALCHCQQDIEDRNPSGLYQVDHNDAPLSWHCASCSAKYWLARVLIVWELRVLRGVGEWGRVVVSRS